MAILGLLITGENAELEPLRERLLADAEICTVQATDDPMRLAAVLEASTLDMEAAILRIRNMPDVLAVDVAFVNYEDDMDDRGHIPCPPIHGQDRKKDVH